MVGAWPHSQDSQPWTFVLTMPLPGQDAKKEVEKRNAANAARARQKLGIVDPFSSKWKKLEFDRVRKQPLVKT